MENERIRWGCRRGMLELDLFLMPFYENCFASLSNEQKSAFYDLLALPDPELFQYCMGLQVPTDPIVAQIATQIRHFKLGMPLDPP